MLNYCNYHLTLQRDNIVNLLRVKVKECGWSASETCRVRLTLVSLLWEAVCGFSTLCPKEQITRVRFLLVKRQYLLVDASGSKGWRRGLNKSLKKRWKRKNKQPPRLKLKSNKLSKSRGEIAEYADNLFKTA